MVNLLLVLLRTTALVVPQAAAYQMVRYEMAAYCSSIVTGPLDDAPGHRLKPNPKTADEREIVDVLAVGAG